MRASEAPPAAPLLLEGDAFARGLAQARARPELAAAVRAAVELRLAELQGADARPEIAAFLAGQRAATERHHPEALHEIAGLARGFELAPGRLFLYLHVATILDLVEARAEGAEGCTALAVATGAGALLAKNRDYRDEHRALQQVMLHRPAQGRSFLVVGSLGAPGCFSSGVNADGLALADTATRTRDLGPGLHRYFLLTLLLERCATVEAALRAIRAIPHTGSGCLVLADARGAVAAVELGHARVGIEQATAGRIGRTNHHVLPATAPADLRGPASAGQGADSRGRLPVLRAALEALPRPPGLDAVAALLARHRDAAGPAFCRHGGEDLAATISGSIWDTGRRRLVFCAGPPCGGGWRSFDLAPEPGARPSGSLPP